MIVVARLGSDDVTAGPHMPLLERPLVDLQESMLRVQVERSGCVIATHQLRSLISGAQCVAVVQA